MDDVVSEDDARRSRPIRDVLQIFLVTRLALVAVASLSTFVVRHGRWWGHPRGLLELFFRWDSAWYLDIVGNGYSYSPGKQSNVAFFPGYPLLVRFFARPFHDPRPVGFVISNLALVLALVAVYRLTERETGSARVARRAVVLIALWPTSFFFSVFYSESLYLALAVLAFSAARDGRFVLAGCAGAALSATRPVGVIVMLPILVEALEIDFGSWRPKLRRALPKVVGVVTPGLGILLYMLYLGHRFGDPLAFVHAAGAWNRSLVGPIESIRHSFGYGTFYVYLFVGSLVWAWLVCAYMMARRMRLSLVVYAAVSVLVVSSWNYLEAAPRYLSVIFPLFPGAAMLCEELPVFESFSLVVFPMLLSLCTVLFVNGYWMT